MLKVKSLVHRATLESKARASGFHGEHSDDVKFVGLGPLVRSSGFRVQLCDAWALGFRFRVQGF